MCLSVIAPTQRIETWAGRAWATRILAVALLLGHAHFCFDPLGAQVWGDIGVYGGHCVQHCVHDLLARGASSRKGEERGPLVLFTWFRVCIHGVLHACVYPWIVSVLVLRGARRGDLGGQDFTAPQTYN